MNGHTCLIVNVTVEFCLSRHGDLRLIMRLVLRPHLTLYLLWLLLHHRSWVNLRHRLLKLRKHLSRLVLLSIEFSLKCFIFSMRSLKLVKHWLLEPIKVFLLLVQLLAKVHLNVFKSLLEELELSLRDPLLVIKDLLIFLVSRDVFLHYLCQSVHLLFHIICLDRCNCVLAYRGFYLAYHLLPQIFDQSRQLVVSDVL